MEMRKIDERIYEFFNLDYVDQIDEVETLEEEVTEEKELSISVERFFELMLIGLNELSVEDAESIGLI